MLKTHRVHHALRSAVVLSIGTLAALVLILSLPTAAQTPTLVTGQAKDVNGVPYSFARVSASLAGIPPNVNATIIVNGIPTAIGGQQNASADANGNFTMNLFCNTAGGGCSVISPSGTNWQITVNENGVPPPIGTGPQTCSATVSVSGASQSVSASFAACPALSTTGGGASTGVTNTFTVPQIFNADATFRGPNPNGVDMRAFNVRAVNSALIPSPTCTINSGLNTATCSSANGLQKNDGFAIVNAGATQSMTTPVAPTVTPSCASGPLGLGLTVAAGAGATPYAYSIAMRDTGQGLTAASPQGNTATGNASLGANNTPITTIVPGIANTFTATIGSSANLAPGCMIEMKGSTNDGEFGGWKIVAAVPDGTHITFTSGVNAINGISTANATGGTLFYWLCNLLALPTPGAGGLQFLTYGRTAGSQNLIGMSTIANLGYTDASYLKFEDYGSPMMDGMTAPWWAPATAPASAINDTFVSTITGIAGNVLTLSATAPNSSGAGSKSRFDNSPNIAACIAATNSFSVGAGGTCRFPVVVEDAAGDNCYATSSYLVVGVSSPIPSMIQDGDVCLGDTLQLTGSWYGTNLSSARIGSIVPPNSARQYIPILLQGANPGIYIKQGGLNNVTVSMSGNNAIGVFNTTGANTSQIFENVNFFSASQTIDYMTIPFYDYENSVNGGFGGKMRNTTFSTGPAQTDGITAAPSFATKFNQEWDFDYTSCNRRTYAFIPQSSGLIGKLHMGAECQGPIMPLITFLSLTPGNTGGSFIVETTVNDTGAAPMIANLGPACCGLGAGITVIGSNLPSSGQPFFSGNPFTNISLIGVWFTSAADFKNAGQNTNLCVQSATNGFLPGIACSAYNLTSLLFSKTIPTISSGFGTTPSVVNQNGTGFFTINVGTGGTATAGVIGMPAAAHNWNCPGGLNITAHAGNRADDTVQTASTTTSVTVQNQTKSTGAAVAWTASDILQLSCTAN